MDTLETIFLSRLQHYLFCPRQFALIELEDQWVENILTAQGQVLHQRVNEQASTQRGQVRIVRALPLASARYGIEGIADVVELHRQEDQSDLPYPIEYKRGKPKTHRADEVQLCAQALCLEEMFACPIEHGALFYGETHRRCPIVFDDDLRALTLQTIAACRALIKTGITPPAHYSKATCPACSLQPICHPTQFQKSAQHWLAQQLKD